jgi:RNA polymerase sigma-70 factor (ECF subfamily)
MTDSTLLSDEELLRRSSLGDEFAFTALYRRRQSNVFRFAIHMCGRQEVAEEVVQDVFLSLIREPERFDADKGSVAAYLIGVARNLVRRRLERERSYVELDDDEAAGPAEDADVLGELTREEAIGAVRRAVLSLPAAYREAVVLCDLEEVSYAEAAAMLGVPVGTVRSRLSRGRGLLVEKLRAGRLGNSAARCSA